VTVEVEEVADRCGTGTEQVETTFGGRCRGPRASLTHTSTTLRTRISNEIQQIELLRKEIADDEALFCGNENIPAEKGTS